MLLQTHSTNGKPREMLVKLKGVNRKRVILASGRKVTYYYAWKGGPRLAGEPGSQEFLASYHDAMASRSEPSQKTLTQLFRAYVDSQEFRAKAARTRADYVRLIEKIEKEFGDFPIAAVADPRARDEFLTWRDRLAKSSVRQAEYTLTVLSIIFSWAKNRRKIPMNPLEKMGRIYRGARAAFVWTERDEAAFMSAASEPLRLAMMLALWTGQRQGDLLRLTWSAYDGEWIRLKQGKTGARLAIPVGAQLKAILDATQRVSPLMLVNTDGSPWSPDGFRASWRKACQRAGISGLTFHDLRGTAVTRLAIAGASEPEIAAITGHSAGDVQSILEKHYLHRDPKLAINAIAKLERGTKTPE